MVSPGGWVLIYGNLTAERARHPWSQVGRDWFGKGLDFQPPKLALMVTKSTLQFSKEKEQERAIMRHLDAIYS